MFKFQFERGVDRFTYGLVTLHGKWLAGRAEPLQELQLVAKDGTVHRFKAHEMRMGMNPPEFEIDVGRATRVLKVIKTGDIIEAVAS